MKATQLTQASKLDRVVDRLRSDVVSGRLGVGDRLPTYPQLQRRFAAGSATMVRAVNQLRREGFLVGVERKGVFVAAHPPHLTHHLLFIRERAEDAIHGSSFYRGLVDAASRAPVERRVSVLFGHHGRPAPEDEADLVQDLRAGRYAGVIFASVPDELEGSAILEAHGVPRVAIAAEPRRGVHAVWPDWQAFAARAADALTGRRRLAIIAAQHALEPAQCVASAADRVGLEAPPLLRLHAPMTPPEGAAGLARLMMALPGGLRPDAVVICDDNLVTGFTHGLREAGVRSPRDLAVVAHANFPMVTPSAVPAIRIGFDVGDLLNLCVDQIARLRRNPTIKGSRAGEWRDVIPLAPVVRDCS